MKSVIVRMQTNYIGVPYNTITLSHYTIFEI